MRGVIFGVSLYGKKDDWSWVSLVYLLGSGEKDAPTFWSSPYAWQMPALLCWGELCPDRKEASSSSARIERRQARARRARLKNSAGAVLARFYHGCLWVQNLALAVSMFDKSNAKACPAAAKREA